MNVYNAIDKELFEARKKHPDFAYGIFHALGFLGEEYGEVSKEITKQEPGWEERMDAELLDLIAVAIRMLRREYVHEEPTCLSD